MDPTRTGTDRRNLGSVVGNDIVYLMNENGIVTRPEREPLVNVLLPSPFDFHFEFRRGIIFLQIQHP